jgi:hypothetical protein
MKWFRVHNFVPVFSPVFSYIYVQGLVKDLKFEIRISKFETNSNDRNSNDQNKKNPKASYHAALVLDFEHLNFDIVSDFVLRADPGRGTRRCKG